jgi:RimJ/RimL family protein N-acetyltransferase
MSPRWYGKLCTVYLVSPMTDGVLDLLWNWMNEDKLRDLIFFDQNGNPGIGRMDFYQRMMDPNIGMLMVFDNESHDAVGCVWFNHCLAGRSEVHIYFRKKYWGTPVIREASLIGLHVAFNVLGIRILLGTTSTKNKLAMAFAKKWFNAAGEIPSFFNDDTGCLVSFLTRSQYLEKYDSEAQEVLLDVKREEKSPESTNGSVEGAGGAAETSAGTAGATVSSTDTARSS